MSKPDYDHMKNVIIEQMSKLARDEGQNRDKEFGQFIEFLNDMHCTAVMSLAGAVLFSTQMTSDEEKIPKMLAAIRKLVEAADNSFSLKMRSMILDMANTHNLPDPFATPDRKSN